MKRQPEYSGGKSCGKRKAVSVKWRLLIALLLLTVASLVLIWVAQSVFLSKIYIGIKKKELHEVAGELVAVDSEELYDELTTQSREHGLCIAAYSISEDGEITFLGSSEARPNCACIIHQLYRRISPNVGMIAKTAIENLAAAAEAREGFCFLDYDNSGAIRDVKTPSDAVESTQADPFFGAEPDTLPPEIGKTGGKADGKDGAKDGNRTASGQNATLASENMTAVSVTQTEGAKLVLLLNTSVVPMDTTVETINSMMIYLSVFVILGAIIFALIIALWITKPIEDINRSAKRLAECDYSVKFEGKGYKEVEELSDTLNYAAEELSKTDVLQKELIANISHDLRTPLTLIAGYAEVMRDLPDEKTEENLQIIIDESNRMKALVNDVLDISKLGAGTESLTFETLPLTNSIESELTRYNKLRDRDGYIIEFNYDEQVTVRGDYTRLMQVVYNLVNNAVNYAGPDKKVIVTQTVKNGRVRISVTDHGEGIAEEELPKIWDRYYKVDKTHKRATVGSGLGLSIVKGVVTAHGGTYGVTSVKGEGSTFYFELDVLNSTPISDK